MTDIEIEYNVYRARKYDIVIVYDSELKRTHVSTKKYYYIYFYIESDSEKYPVFIVRLPRLPRNRGVSANGS